MGGNLPQMPKLGAVYLFNHSNCSHQSLEVVTEKMTITHSSMCIVPFSLVLPLAVTRCHLLSFVVIRCHSLSQVDIRCTTHCHFCHSLLFVVTHCTSLCHSLLLVITWCITSLSFYKRLIQSIKFATTYSLKIDVHKFEKCKRENL